MKVQILPRERCLRGRGVSPSLDLAVQVAAPSDLHPKAAAVILAGVLPRRPAAIGFDGRPAELLRVCPGQAEPETLGRFHLGVLMDLQPEYQI